MIRLATALFVTPLIGACTTVANINVRDNVTFNNIEASFQVSKDKNSRIRLRAAAVSADYNQSLNEGHILINGTPLWSPTQVSGTTDIDYLSIDYGWDNLNLALGPESTTGFMYFGYQKTDLDFTLNHAGTSYQVVDKISQLFFEAGLRIKLSEELATEISDAIALSQEGSAMNQIDLKLIYLLTENLLVTGGYRFYSFTYMEKVNTSDIIVEFKGPFIGLNLYF